MKSLLPLLLALAVSATSLPSVAHAETAKKSTSKAATSAKSTTASKKKVVAKSKKASKKASKKPVKRVERSVNHAGEDVNFTEWKAVNDFADEMATKHGFARADLGKLLGQARFVDSAVQLVKPGPVGKPKNMNGVRELMIEKVRINAGVKFWNDHADTLARAEQEFGVPAEVIVGILGIETVYGRNVGKFRVVDVLTTLAFAYPEAPNKAARMAFFRGELENTLLLARKQSIDPFSLLGSFAGAVGLPQFMPGSVLAHAVDFDKDGAIDLRTSPQDAIGSIANFLVKHGWKRDQNGPMIYRAHLSPGRGWEGFLNQGLEAKFDVAQLQAAGVATAKAPVAGRKYGLLDLQNGADATEYWVAANNFFAITQYNRSYYYAMSVIELGRAVKLTMAGSPVIPGETL